MKTSDDLGIWLIQNVRKQLLFVRYSVYLKGNSSSGLIQRRCKAALRAYRCKNDDDDDGDEADNDDNKSRPKQIF